MRRAAFFLIIGLGGVAILISLGIWQMQRLAWKQSVIGNIEARIVAEPVALPVTLDPVRDAHLPVTVNGTIPDTPIFVLVSHKDYGAGYRVIAPLVTDEGRRVLVDLGFVPTQDKEKTAIKGRADLIGNLQWPQETDGFTPVPDLENNIWFARDVPAMATTLVTEPALIVVRSGTVDGASRQYMPVDTARIPNDHLQYAITWFSLAAIWLAMSVYFVRRSATQSKG